MVSGNRLSEHDSGRTVLREYIWLDGRPLAVVEGGQTYWLNWDQIGRPVMATSATAQAIRTGESQPHHVACVNQFEPNLATLELKGKFMRYVATVASGVVLASGLSLVSAEEPSLDLPAPDPAQQLSKRSLPSTSQAAYVVPVEIREILEQQSAARAAEVAGSPQAGAPQMNQSTR